MVERDDDAHLSRHPIFARSDVLNAANHFSKLTTMLDRLFPGKNSCLVFQALSALYTAKQQGYELDVSAFAASMNIPRTSAHRLLNQWQKQKYVDLERKGRKTLIHLTPLTLDRLLACYQTYIDTSATFRN